MTTPQIGFRRLESVGPVVLGILKLPPTPTDEILTIEVHRTQCVVNYKSGQRRYLHYPENVIMPHGRTFFRVSDPTSVEFAVIPMGHAGLVNTELEMISLQENFNPTLSQTDVT